MSEDLVMTDRMQGVDCYWCEDGTPHRHERPESTPGGVLDPTIQQAHDRLMRREALPHPLSDCLLVTLFLGYARAERLETAARDMLHEFDRQVRSHPASDERDPLDLYTEPMLRLRAALAAAEKEASGG